MFLKILKYFITINIFLYHSLVFSKTVENNNFNHRYLSNYFSAQVSHENGNNDLAIQYFNSTKSVLRAYPDYFDKYIETLVLNGKVDKAIEQIKFFNSKDKINNFQKTLLLTVSAIKNSDFDSANTQLLNMDKVLVPNSYEQIIFQILKSFNQLFLKKEVSEFENYGTLNKILLAFQYCYLEDEKSNKYFSDVINLGAGDYSRYLFFYISNLISKNELELAKKSGSKIEPITSTLLILQTKNWLDNSDFDKFSKIFSCNSQNDILSEIFFLLSNLYSSQEEYEMSNFYLNISNYLNPNFKFNLSLLSENYYITGKDKDLKKILKNFELKDDIYYWYRIKKEFEILNEQKGKEISLSFLMKELKKLKIKSPKIYFDLGNIYKNFKEYEKSIENYNFALKQLSKDSNSYADILYRRGGSFERMGNYDMGDKDLLLSLELNSDQPYVLNYLAYSWLERKININQSMKMLLKAHEQRQDDPYITDSVGWAYYLTKDYVSAEKYLKNALLIMPDDPIVNDHYGDVLWKLDMKLQASYYWKSVLSFDDTEEELKENIKNKLIFGLKN
tara:strand:- start:112 stop:1794 length:1683 start_codon:yes stop_codon:yes gene_type:complete